MRFFRVKNFERFQHYKDRSPPWIKLYNELLDDYQFGCLPDASKSHLIAIWLLASRSENRIPHDPRWVQNRISATELVDLDLLEASGFIVSEQPCSEVLASRMQCAGPETEGEGETEEETEKKQEGGAASAPPAPDASHVKHDAGSSAVTKVDKKPSRATRLPADFEVPEGWIMSAAEARQRHDLPEVNLKLEAEQFVLHFTGSGKSNAAKIDWRRTFIKWCLKAEPPRGNGRAPPQGTDGLAGAVGSVVQKFRDEEDAKRRTTEN